MQTIAQGWLVLKLTNSPFWLGLDTFMVTAPALIFTPIGGVFADIISSRKRLLILTQAAVGMAALALALLVGTGVVEIWMILILSFTSGCCMALAWPAYQAITVDLAQPNALTKAVAFYSIQKQLSRVIGPLVAALTIKTFGLTGCFLANGLSCAAVIVALAGVEIKDTNIRDELERSTKHFRTMVSHLTDGLRYVQHRPRVRTLLKLSTFGTFFSAPWLAMIPLFARDINGGEISLAIMMGAVGTGAFSSALLHISVSDFKRKGLVVLYSLLLLSVSLTGFALSSNLHVSLVFLFAVGFTTVNFASVIHVLLHQLVTDQMRGRVMSMLVLSVLGPMPVSSFGVGLIAQSYGPRRTLAVTGIILGVFTLVTFLRNRSLRELD